ncbi:MAG: hypothetical protein JWN64_349 [Parcubacteria group bacterium]|nr:hypothetical protein [Parcubacteria group bacterium]
MFKSLISWIQQNERHLGGVLFVGGFITDLLTFTLLDISIVNLLFAGYLIGAAVCVFGSHLAYTKGGEKPKLFLSTLRVVLPLAAQYLLGSLLSGFLIFYTKSSVVAVSWPFLVLIGLVFLGNEWFRKYRDRTVFLAVLLFFTLYAYSIFALPLLVHELGPIVFLGSSVISVAVFALFMFLLWRTGKTRLKESLTPIIGSSLAIVIVVVVSYFIGLVPPIPLTLKEGNIYHAVSHTAEGYVVQTEASRMWWGLRSQVIHVAPGETLYAFTSIFAPIKFSTSTIHEWEHYDTEKNKWVTEGRVTFPISGGRAEGYRGYSERSSLAAGKWRVMVKTPSGQVIGRIPFVVEEVTTPPTLREETH